MEVLWRCSGDTILIHHTFPRQKLYPILKTHFDLGIRTGESAAELTRSLRQYLQHPDWLPPKPT